MIVGLCEGRGGIWGGGGVDFRVPTTVYWEIFIVNIFLDSMASAKIKRTKIMRIINDNAVRGRLSENLYLLCEIFAIYGIQFSLLFICDMLVLALVKIYASKMDLLHSIIFQLTTPLIAAPLIAASLHFTVDCSVLSVFYWRVFFVVFHCV